MTQHTVVVGAGIVGVCSALSLATAGQRVTLIDRQGPGEGASFGNASILATWAVVPVQTPGILWRVPKMLLDPLGPLAIRWRYLPKLAPWLLRFLAESTTARVEALSISLGELMKGAVDAFNPLLEAAGAKGMIQRAGKIEVFETEKGFHALKPIMDIERRRGVRIEELDVHELRQLEPGLAPLFVRALFYPDVAHVVDNYRLVQVLAEAVVRHGGAVVKADVRGFEVGPDGPRAVLTDAGSHPCDHVVIAAGAWSKPLAAKLGSAVPLDTERGYHVHLPTPGVLLRHPVHSSERAVAMTPLETGIRLAGTVELGGLDAPPDWRRADILLKSARPWLPGLETAGMTRWMGFRPSMPDSLPVISRSPVHKNVLFAFGHGHVGLTLAARTGKIVADMAAGRDPGIDLRPYRVDRF
ncbi:MAG: FAD-dependent oxidoreductase [Rhodospirillales bacterium]|nr:FAD-dependent oxidoreductase [Rhodospirillales bacterium]